MRVHEAIKHCHIHTLYRPVHCQSIGSPSTTIIIQSIGSKYAARDRGIWLDRLVPLQLASGEM